MRVLLAADGSIHGTAALRTACRILSPVERRADVLCVASPLHPKRPGLQRRLVRRATAIADAVSKQLAQDGFAATPAVRTGSPARVLIGATHEYDVAVISAQSHKGISDAGIGPVTSRVLDHANASVLLARSGYVGSPIKILVPVDGSDAALQALEMLPRLVELRACEVTLVHVVETPWIRPVDDQEWISTEEEPDQEPQSELEQEFTQEAEALIEQARDRLPPRTAVDSMIFHGLPAEEILAEANSGEYSLIVLAATGEHDLKHRILGSVSGKVAWNAPCSVLLVRPAAG